MRRKPFPALSLALKVGGRLHQGRRAALRARRRGKQLMGRGADVVCCRGCSCGSGSSMPHLPRALVSISRPFCRNGGRRAGSC